MFATSKFITYFSVIDFPHITVSKIKDNLIFAFYHGTVRASRAATLLSC